MHINILAVGKLKEKYWTESQNEYLKRLRAYAKCEVKEVVDERFAPSVMSREIEQVKNREGKRLQSLIDETSYLIALDCRGKMLESEEFAGMLKNLALTGKSNVSFIIGGSLGLSGELLSRADFLLSFSRFTFPHQLMRVILLEQIFRSFKIIKNEPYHR
ncbi:protein of unknown function DUF163 [Desulfofarcimen acetoxidans DSM 771]|uniref:Ribosomal RNA large subunit methyltransferase H n=1 Tax=Desulfofarcimen acetoxidans (strain ATCC 49208 / DSM 771 / KCTC 5769 / VKM B-1644 / 5575) TaxID=485916 RepID=C8VVF2_DESAS|nr:23S rRNA (pseudouridine(1915)-N(3))-methyltransferase RlmH [Desulfofarcimen acetoxidans]ACV61036.1 protein of unknown function DUF163 [Desulfofarcimen acetoxidans DSM 771]